MKTLPKLTFATQRRAVAYWLLVTVGIAVLSVLWPRALPFADAAEAAGVPLRVSADDRKVHIATESGGAVCDYQLSRPTDSKLSVESGCFFHPLCAPSGLAVTDLAPDDHPHHRGVFLGFVEMRGAKHDADFWGWGEHAPTDGRRIESVGVTTSKGDDDRTATVAFDNAWRVGGDVMLDERLVATVRATKDANVLDLDYRLTPHEDVRLPRWAFSGFCVRLRKDGKIVYTSPDGAVDRPPLDHLKPQLDWPAAAWYDATVTLADGKQVGVAVVDHPANPPSLWHNESRIHMLNPCIVAPGEVKLVAGKPLVLSYRLVVHDGPAAAKLIDGLAGEFRESRRGGAE